MKTAKVLWWGFIDAIGVVVYTGVVAWVITHAGEWLGAPRTFLGPATLLLLFVLSAAVAGSLVFGKPVLLYLAGEKREAIAVFLATIAILLIVLFFVLLVQI